MNNTYYIGFSSKFRNFFQSYSSIIFFIIVSVLLGAAIYSMSSVVITSLEESPDSKASTSTLESLDKKTIEYIKNLQKSDDQNLKTISLPSSRLSPLVE